MTKTLRFSQYKNLQEKFLLMDDFKEKDRVALVFWTILNTQYSYFDGGFRGWHSAQDMAADKQVFFSLEFEGDSIQDIRKDNIYCLAVYKKILGNKMVAFATNPFIADRLFKNLKPKANAFIQERLGGPDWIEASGKMLSFIVKNSANGTVIPNIDPHRLIEFGMKGIKEDTIGKMKVYASDVWKYDRLMLFNNKYSTETAWGHPRKG